MYTWEGKVAILDRMAGEGLSKKVILERSEICLGHSCPEIRNL